MPIPLSTDHETHETAPRWGIEGWASRIHLPIDHEAPSVVVSPDATAQSLMAWALGQIGQLNVLLETIGMAEEFSSCPPPSALAGAIRHQLEQVESVLIAVVGRLPDET